MSVRVLVIEDQPEWQACLGEWLSWALPGCEITPARTGEAAMIHLRDGGPWHLITIDLDLSDAVGRDLAGADGFQLLEPAAAAKGSPPVFVITGVHLDPKFRTEVLRSSDHPVSRLRNELMRLFPSGRGTSIAKEESTGEFLQEKKQKYWKDGLKALIDRNWSEKLSILPPYRVEVSGYFSLDPRGYSGESPQTLQSVRVKILGQRLFPGRPSEVLVEPPNYKLLLHSLAYYSTAAKHNHRSSAFMDVVEASAILALGKSRSSPDEVNDVFTLSREFAARMESEEELRRASTTLNTEFGTFTRWLRQSLGLDNSHLVKRQGYATGIWLQPGVVVSHTDPSDSELIRNGVLFERTSGQKWERLEIAKTGPPAPAALDALFERRVEQEVEKELAIRLQSLQGLFRHCTQCGEALRLTDREQWTFCTQCGSQLTDQGGECPECALGRETSFGAQETGHRIDLDSHWQKPYFRGKAQRLEDREEDSLPGDPESGDESKDEWEELDED